MTAVAAAPRRTTTARQRERRRSAPRTDVRVARAYAQPRTGLLATMLVVGTVLALVIAVVFHVVLAQHQMELDHINGQIAKEQRAYEKLRLSTASLSAPQRIIQEAERLGLVFPAQPPRYLAVPNAPMPTTGGGATDTTIDGWTKAKPSLGNPQP